MSGHLQAWTSRSVAVFHQIAPSSGVASVVWIHYPRTSLTNVVPAGVRQQVPTVNGVGAACAATRSPMLPRSVTTIMTGAHWQRPALRGSTA